MFHATVPFARKRGLQQDRSRRLAVDVALIALMLALSLVWLLLAGG
jgi:hypothetical protein